MVLALWAYIIADFSTLENVGHFLLGLVLVVLIIPLSVFIPFELLISLPLPWKRGGD